MKKYLRAMVAFIMTMALMLSMAACGGEETPSETTQTTVTTSEPTSAPTGVTGDPSADPDTPPEQLATGYNILTGLDDMGGSDLTRPVGIMVANNDFIQDEQVGIGQADMWVEMETEGGITRLMAVFANTERVPEAIGPIRSARSPFFHVVEALGLGYVHAGGSYTALAKIASSSIADLDVNTGDSGSYSWRDSSYPQAYEYRLRTGGSALTRYMNDKGYSTEAVKTIPWTFGAQTGDAATDIDITLSYAQKIGFTYDEATSLYQKTNGSSETPHYDGAGNPLQAKNVIVLYTDKIMENDVTHDFALGYGEGYVFSDGVMRRFDWSREGGSFTMTEKDGSQLTLAKGKVYLCVASAELESSISY